MNLRKVKKTDLYPILDEIQKEFKNKFNLETLRETNSDTYGLYNRELCFILNNKTPDFIGLSNELCCLFNKLHCGFESVIITEFPEHYPDLIKFQLEAEVVAYYISTERLNDLAVNDDLRLARFIVKNKDVILSLIKGC